MMKCRVGFFVGLIIIFTTNAGIAQVFDNFSDGEFRTLPSWKGDTADFNVNAAFQLQLQSTGTDTSYLATENLLADSTEWLFWIKLAFSPSTNNFARYYLMSDQANLKGPLQGYFLQFGEAGSNDAITLFRQSGYDTSVICRGPAGMVASSFAVGVKVTRKQNGYFQVFADPGGGVNFTKISEGTDLFIQNTQWTGILCRYTSSNSSKFYFDDIIIRHIYIDTIPPLLQKLEVLNDSSVLLTFDEPVDRASAFIPSNYFVNMGIQSPCLIIYDSLTPSLVRLSFSTHFPAGQVLSILIQNLKDKNGNLMLPVNLEFMYYLPQPFDILINEVMADPEPQVGLPPFEYIELYNRTQVPITIQNWSLWLGTSRKTLPAYTFPPQSFLLVGKEDARLFLSKYSPFAGFSSFSLSNEEGNIILTNENEQVISFFSYNLSMYNNPVKEAGGWALEQIDPFNPCGESSNWTASVARKGGTPGQENSVMSHHPDLLNPWAERMIPLDDTAVRLFFSEPMNTYSLEDPAHYFFDQGLGNPVHCIANSPDYRSVDLIFQEKLMPETRYSLQINDTITDCAGNPLKKADTLRVELPQPPSKKDIVINEILFNPKDDGVDFVELYNRSKKVLDLKECLLARLDTFTNQTEEIRVITEEGYLLFPDQYVVITTNPDRVKTQYPHPGTRNFIRVNSMPALNNDAGVVLLLDMSEQILDKVSYRASMHHPLLKTVEGVSLERISPDVSADDPGNWHSAAESVGFATPGYKNSQAFNPMYSSDDLNLEPEVFSPDNDGFDDVVAISLNQEKPGNITSLYIYNEQGQLIKTLTRSNLSGIQNTYFWNGLDEHNRKVPIGPYILMAEIFNMEKQVRLVKKTVFVAGMLR